MTEKEYRDLPSTSYKSYSSLKAFEKTGSLEPDTKREDSNDGLLYGKLSDILAFTPEDFDDMFYVSKIDKPLTKTEEKLYKLVLEQFPIESLTEEELSTDIFKELCLELMQEHSLWNNIVDRKKLLEKIDNNFINHLLEYNISQGKTIITSKDYLDAQYQIKVLKENKFTKKYFDNADIKKSQVLFQTAILYKIDTDDFKSLLDIILIDHENRVIRAVDLKTGAIPRKYFKLEFFKRRYDIQAALYTKALEEYMVRHNLKDYKLLNPLYIYAPRFEQDSPLVFQISEEVIKASFTGFITPTGRRYKGIYELTEEMNWVKELGVENYTMEEYNSDGELMITFFNTLGNVERTKSWRSNTFSYWNRNTSRSHIWDSIDGSDPIESRFFSTTTELEQPFNDDIERNSPDISTTRPTNDNVDFDAEMQAYVEQARRQHQERAMREHARRVQMRAPGEGRIIFGRRRR